MTPETIAELRRLAEAATPGTVGVGTVSDRKRVHLDEVDFLLRGGESPERIAQRLGVTTEAIGRAFARSGDNIKARPFWSAYQRGRRAALADALATRAERDALAAKVARVRAMHRPAYNDVARSPMCEECGGKAGVHPCGCWAEDDYEFVCAVCNQGTKNQSVPWPCPTIAALDEEAQP